MQEMQMKVELSIHLGNEGPKVEQKKFPHYHKEDNTEAFLFSFERLCKDLGMADTHTSL